MTEDDLDAHERYITEGEVAAWDDDFLARNGHRVTAVIRRAGLSAEDAIRELRRFRALVESVKALAWGDHECAGADPAAIREYLRDLLMSEPDGAEEPDDPDSRYEVEVRDFLRSVCLDADHQQIIRLAGPHPLRPANFGIFCRACVSPDGGISPSVSLELTHFGTPDGRPISAYVGRCPSCRAIYWAMAEPHGPADAAANSRAGTEGVSAHAADRRR